MRIFRGNSRGNFWKILSVVCCLAASSLALGLDGDLNADGAIDLRDLIRLQQHLKGEVTLSGDAFTRADVAPLGDSTQSPGDGVLNAADMVLLLRTLRGDDVDADGLTLSCEIASSTSPFDTDTDNDGVSDADEDPDQDFFSNAEECARNTDPQISDRIEMGNFWFTPTTSTGWRTIKWDPVAGAAGYRIHVITIGAGESPQISNYEMYEVAGSETQYSFKNGASNAKYVLVQAIAADGTESEFFACTSVDLNQPDILAHWLNLGGGTMVTTLPFQAIQSVGGTVELNWEGSKIVSNASGTPPSGVVVYRAGSARPIREWDRPSGDAGGWQVVSSVAMPDPLNPPTNITFQNLANGVYTFRAVPYWGSAPTALPVNEEYQPAGGYFQRVVQVTDSVFAGADLDVVQVDVGEGYACARKSDDSTLCWGDAGNPGPASSGFYKDFSVGDGLACGVRSADNALECWGTSSHPAYTPPSGAFVKVQVGGQAACALREDGTAACWGVVASPSASKHYRSIAVGDDFACGVESAGAAIGALDCWGVANWQDKLLNPIPAGNSYSEVVVNWGAVEVRICAREISTGVVDCGASAPESGQYRKYDLGMLGRCSIVFAAYSSECGLEEKLYYERRVRIYSDSSRGYESVALGLNVACGVTSANGEVHLRVNCWGYFDVPVPTDWRIAGTGLAAPVGPDPLPTLRDMPGRLVSGGSFSCEFLYVDDIRCWGNNNAYGQLSPPMSEDWPDGPGYSEMWAGKDHACGRNYNATIECWGRDDAGQVSGLPVNIRDGVVEYARISLGSDYACAFFWTGEENNTVCWGSMPQPPSGFQHFGDWEYATGTDHVCALQPYTYEYYGPQVASLYTVTCWGNNAKGQLNVPTPLTSVPAEWTRVASGARFSCGVRYSGVSLEPVEGGMEFVYDYNAVQPLKCWGDTSNQQLAVPSYFYVDLWSGSESTEIQLGDGYGCAWRYNFSDSSKPYWKCWGTKKPAGFPDSPTGVSGQYDDTDGSLKYSNFSFGDRHICAIDEKDPERDVVCWGDVLPPPSRTTLP